VNGRFACADDRNLIVADAATGTAHWQFTHPVAVSQVALLSDDRVITGCQDGSLRAFRGATGEPLSHEFIHRQTINFWQIIPERQQLLTSSEDLTICLLDLKTLKVIRKFTHPETHLRAFAVAGGRRILVCEMKGFSLLDSETGQLLLSIKDPIDPFSPRLSPDGRSLAALTRQDSVLVFRLE
jgi:WD40 repeat protein